MTSVERLTDSSPAIASTSIVVRDIGISVWSCTIVVPSSLRNRMVTGAGTACGFASRMSVSKNIPVAPSASRYVNVDVSGSVTVRGDVIVAAACVAEPGYAAVIVRSPGDAGVNITSHDERSLVADTDTGASVQLTLAKTSPATDDENVTVPDGLPGVPLASASLTVAVIGLACCPVITVSGVNVTADVRTTTSTFAEATLLPAFGSLTLDDAADCTERTGASRASAVSVRVADAPGARLAICHCPVAALNTPALAVLGWNTPLPLAMVLATATLYA